VIWRIFLVILSLTDDVPKWSLEMIAFIWQKICNLGFSQNMNLTSLIREFEMEAAAASGEGPTFRDFKKWKSIEKKVKRGKTLLKWFDNLLNNGKMTDSLMWHWIWMNV